MEHLDTKVVLLCGGQGTRLREETEFKPKPMVTVGSMPIVWHIMKIYSHYGFKDFIICLGYKGEMFKQYFLNQGLMERDITISLKGGNKTVHDDLNEIEDWNITLAETGINTMTGGRVKKIEKYVDGDEFMLTYGDGLSDVNMIELTKSHRKSGTVGTLTGVNPQSRFGMVKTDANDLVTQFVEKPVLYDDFVNGGFYVFRKDFFDYLEADDSCVLEKNPLGTIAMNRQLSMYRHKGFWHCMDTYRDYLELNAIWDKGNAPWKVWK